MERSGNTVGGAGHHPDLAELLRREAPFLTIWASDTSSEARVRDVLRRQAGTSVSEQVVDAMATAVTEHLRAGAGGVVGVADRTGVLLTERLPQPPRRELERLDVLPSLSPLIEHRQGTIPYLLLAIDRRGADLFWSDGAETGSRTVEAPEDMMIQKFKDSDSGSGYRQHDFQQKVEQNWEHIASDVATAVTQCAATVHPRVITVAGDVRMVQLLREQLPHDVAAMLRDVPGSRSEDGSGPLRQEVVARWIRTAVAEDTVEVLQLFERERGQNDRASNGVEDTLTALCEARVDVLLVHDDADDDRRAWFVPEEPTLVATNRETIEGLGYSPVQGRLIDVAIRSALATSGGIRIVPGSGPVHDGLSAILRW
jgi:peptide subunit release factor 1 (eRF1)